MPYEPTVVLSAIEERSSDGVFTHTTVSRARAATVRAVQAIYPLYFGTTSRPPIEVSDLMARDGEKVTVLIHRHNNLFRTPQLIAVEGRIITAAKTTPLGLIFKGHRNRGIALSPTDLVDAVPGWGKAAVSALKARCEAVRALLPHETAPLTAEVISAIPEDTADSASCATVLLTSTHLPHEDPVHGCLWLVSDRTSGPSEDILNGVLLTPPTASLVSEHGSIYAGQLPPYTAHLPTATTITYAEAVDLADAINGKAPERGYLTALARLNPRP